MTYAEATMLDDRVERDTRAVECPKCRGFAAEVDCLPEEIALQTCGRSHACCISAFVCKKCGTRILARLHSPEME